tara:strand:+ start:491 stop:778 length:288 start_codon:yes stop_codon:yes gene_type:complete
MPTTDISFIQIGHSVNIYLLRAKKIQCRDLPPPELHQFLRIHDVFFKLCPSRVDGVLTSYAYQAIALIFAAVRRRYLLLDILIEQCTLLIGDKRL